MFFTNTNKHIYILKIQGSTKVNTQTKHPPTHTQTLYNNNYTIKWKVHPKLCFPKTFLEKYWISKEVWVHDCWC